jgi:hypothetical protein
MAVFNIYKFANNKTRNLSGWKGMAIWTRSSMQGPEIASMLRYTYISYIPFILCSFLSVSHLIVLGGVSCITWA